MKRRLGKKLTTAAMAVLCVRGTAAWGDCWQEAGARYGVAPRLLQAIAAVESGFNPRALGRNKNGSWDVGLMQINSAWLPALARFGIPSARLWDPCTNIHVGAWVLADNLRRHGNTWTAIGAYNATSPDKRAAYAWKVYHALPGR